MPSLTYVCLVAGFTYQLEDAAFVLVRCCFMVCRSCLLLYCVRAFKCYLDVCLFEKVSDLSNFGAVVGERGPFFVSVISFVLVGFVLYLYFQLLYEV
jgi:hypothetical protein